MLYCILFHKVQPETPYKGEPPWNQAISMRIVPEVLRDKAEPHGAFVYSYWRKALPVSLLQEMLPTSILGTRAQEKPLQHAR